MYYTIICSMDTINDKVIIFVWRVLTIFQIQFNWADLKSSTVFDIFTNGNQISQAESRRLKMIVFHFRFFIFGRI